MTNISIAFLNKGFAGLSGERFLKVWEEVAQKPSVALSTSDLLLAIKILKR